MTQRGLDHIEHIGPDRDARYVHGRAPRRPEMCPRCFSTDTVQGEVRKSEDPLRICNACAEVFT